MTKNYCPVRIKNPNSKDSIVRLLDKQKIHIIFDKFEFNDYKINLSGQYLEIDEVNEIENGWMVSVLQKHLNYHDSTLFLGGIQFFDENDEQKASLCVISSNSNNDYIRVMNPQNETCTISPNQVLDVVMHSETGDMWSAQTYGKDICLELIQHFIRGIKSFCSEGCENKIVFEHFFRFRLDRKSIEYLSKQPYAKHDGGQIVLLNSKNERSAIKVVCVWRGKSSIYKALLLPRIPIVTNQNVFKKPIKKCMMASVKIHKMNSTLEENCNILLAKVN